MADHWSNVTPGLPDARYGALLQTDGTRLWYVGGAPNSVGVHTFVGALG